MTRDDRRLGHHGLAAAMQPLAITTRSSVLLPSRLLLLLKILSALPSILGPIGGRSAAPHRSSLAVKGTTSAVYEPSYHPWGAWTGGPGTTVIGSSLRKVRVHVLDHSAITRSDSVLVNTSLTIYENCVKGSQNSL